MNALQWCQCYGYEQSLTHLLDSYSMRNKTLKLLGERQETLPLSEPWQRSLLLKEPKAFCYCGRNKKPSLAQDPALIQSSVLLSLKAGGGGGDMSHTRAPTDTRHSLAAKGKGTGHRVCLTLKLNQENEEPSLPPPLQASH